MTVREQFRPCLHGVIEAPRSVPGFVGASPVEPWPAFVRLWAQTSDEHVTLVVAQLAQYGHGGGASENFASLADDFPTVAPGGLAAIGETHTIFPSCCAGIEAWRDWYELLERGVTPWLGHDPSPWVDRRGDDYIVRANGGMGEPVSERESVLFARDDLARALGEAEKDLREFSSRLRGWALARAPGQADLIARGFEILARLNQ